MGIWISEFNDSGQGAPRQKTKGLAGCCQMVSLATYMREINDAAREEAAQGVKGVWRGLRVSNPEVI